MDIGTHVQVLDSQGQWKAAEVLEVDMISNKVLVDIEGEESMPDKWMQLGSIKEQVETVLSKWSDEEFKGFCDRAYYDRHMCIPGPRTRTYISPRQQLAATLLEMFDSNQELSEQMTHRMKRQKIVFTNESFLRTAELLAMEVEKAWIVQGFIRRPREERLFQRRQDSSTLPIEKCKTLTVDDSVTYYNGNSNKDSLIAANDPFCGFVLLKTNDLVSYEDLRKESTDEVYDFHLSDSDNSTSDPTWRASPPSKDYSALTCTPSRKRPRQECIRCPAKRQRAGTGHKFQIISRGPAAPLAPLSPPSSDAPSTPSSVTSDERDELTQLRKEIDSLRRDMAQKDLNHRTEMDALRQEFRDFRDMMTTTANAESHTTKATTCSNQTSKATTLTNPDFWLLRPVDLPLTLTDESIGHALKTRPHIDPIEEARRKGSVTRKGFARDIFCTLFQLKDVYDRNVNGVVKCKVGAGKLPLDKNKMRMLFSAVEAAFPGGNGQKDCVTAVNDFNRTLWARKFKNTKLPPMAICEADG